jgi:hypothetical protein
MLLPHTAPPQLDAQAAAGGSLAGLRMVGDEVLQGMDAVRVQPLVPWGAIVLWHNDGQGCSKVYSWQGHGTTVRHLLLAMMLMMHTVTLTIIMALPLLHCGAWARVDEMIRFWELRMHRAWCP